MKVRKEDMGGVILYLDRMGVGRRCSRRLGQAVKGSELMDKLTESLCLDPACTVFDGGCSVCVCIENMIETRQKDREKKQKGKIQSKEPSLDGSPNLPQFPSAGFPFVECPCAPVDVTMGVMCLSRAQPL